MSIVIYTKNNLVRVHVRGAGVQRPLQLMEVVELKITVQANHHQEREKREEREVIIQSPSRLLYDRSSLALIVTFGV